MVKLRDRLVDHVALSHLRNIACRGRRTAQKMCRTSERQSGVLTEEEGELSKEGGRCKEHPSTSVGAAPPPLLKFSSSDYG